MRMPSCSPGSLIMTDLAAQSVKWQHDEELHDATQKLKGDSVQGAEMLFHILAKQNDRISKLEERLQGVLETHHLWDGS